MTSWFSIGRKSKGGGRRRGKTKTKQKSRWQATMEDLFEGVDPSQDPHASQTFWEEHFLLRVRPDFLLRRLELLSVDQLLALKPALNVIFRQCAAAVHDTSAIRVRHALQTLHAMLFGIFAKDGFSNFGYDVINLICDFEDAERYFADLVAGMAEVLREEIDHESILRRVASLGHADSDPTLNTSLGGPRPRRDRDLPGGSSATPPATTATATASPPPSPEARASALPPLEGRSPRSSSGRRSRPGSLRTEALASSLHASPNVSMESEFTALSAVLLTDAVSQAGVHEEYASNVILGNKRLVLTVLATIATGTPHINQNTLVEYLVLNADIYTAILYAYEQDASNGSYASLVLGNAGLAVIATLPQYRRRERSNAFLAELAAIGEARCFENIAATLAASFRAALTEYETAEAPVRPPLASWITSWFAPVEAAVDDSVGVATTGLLLLALQTLTETSRDFLAVACDHGQFRPLASAFLAFALHVVQATATTNLPSSTDGDEAAAAAAAATGSGRAENPALHHAEAVVMILQLFAADARTRSRLLTSNLAGGTALFHANPNAAFVDPDDDGPPVLPAPADSGGVVVNVDNVEVTDQSVGLPPTGSERNSGRLAPLDTTEFQGTPLLASVALDVLTQTLRAARGRRGSVPTRRRALRVILDVLVALRRARVRPNVRWLALWRQLSALMRAAHRHGQKATATSNALSGGSGGGGGGGGGGSSGAGGGEAREYILAGVDAVAVLNYFIVHGSGCSVLVDTPSTDTLFSSLHSHNCARVMLVSGDAVLPNPELYDQLFYELIRVRDDVDALFRLVRLHDSSNGEMVGTMTYVKAITAHYATRIDEWMLGRSGGDGAESGLAPTLTEDVVLTIIRDHYDSLPLAIVPELDDDGGSLGLAPVSDYDDRPLCRTALAALQAALRPKDPGDAGGSR